MVGEGKSACYPFTAVKIHPLLCDWSWTRNISPSSLVSFSVSSAININRGAGPGAETSVEGLYLLFLFCSVAAWKVWRHVASQALLGLHYKTSFTPLPVHMPLLSRVTNKLNMTWSIRNLTASTSPVSLNLAFGSKSSAGLLSVWTVIQCPFIDLMDASLVPVSNSLNTSLFTIDRVS